MLREPTRHGRMVITASAARLRARLVEINAWLRKLQVIAGNDAESPERRSHAAALRPYLRALRLETKAALCIKLRSARYRAAMQQSESALRQLHDSRSDQQKRELQRKSAELCGDAVACERKKTGDQLLLHRITHREFDVPFVAKALLSVGMDPLDDLWPPEARCDSAGVPEQGLATQEAAPAQSGAATNTRVEQMATDQTVPISAKRRGGRPVDKATKAYNELAATGARITPEKLCWHFDRNRVSMPSMLHPALTWKEALEKTPSKFFSWLAEKKRQFRKTRPGQNGKPAAT